jgi:monoamine oxidase
MAGQAKAVAVYNRPFWRDLGLSGEAISHIGPLSQIHDASPAEGAEAALIGFVGRRPVSAEDIINQLVALFGPEAASPYKVLVQDWDEEPETTSLADRQHPGQPNAHMAAKLQMEGNLIWAGAEAALESTGLVEGALAAAEQAAARLLS